MIDLLTALGLMFVIEGASWALFPEGMKRMMERMITLPVQQIRVAGLVFAIFGFLIVGVLRGF
jgi:uncharacterized protein